MKKSVVSLFASLFAIASLGYPWIPGKTALPRMSSELRSAISNVTSQTHIECVEEIKEDLLKGESAYISFVSVKKYNLQELSSIDNSFAPLGVFHASNLLPRCMTNLIDVTSTVLDYPILNKFLKNHGDANVLSYIRRIPNDSSYEEVFALIYVYLKSGVVKFDVDNLKNYQQYLKSLYAKDVKRKLRKEGKSFVVNSDGINPMASYMDAFVAALNSPRFSGLDECMAAIGKNDFSFDDSCLPSVSDVNAFKEKILFGEIPFESPTSTILLICLGVDEYNKFVKEYNGQE